jgi:glycosyltransferase involved in cell wall biosynthesis
MRPSDCRSHEDLTPMPTLPTLSVIFPNYNHGKYLAQCLRSCLAQSAPPQEILVIDDGSTDNSVEIAEEFTRQYPQIRLYRNEVNRGVTFTTNRGVDLATGEYVGLFSVDDELTPGIFEKSLRLLAAYPQAALCGTITEYTDMATGATWYYGAKVSDKPAYLPPARMVELGRQDRLHIASCSMLVRRDCFLAAGKYLADLRWHSDWFLSFVMGFRGGVCFVPEPLAKFFIHPHSLSSKGRSQTKEQLAVLRAILAHLDEERYADVAPYARSALALTHFGKEMLWLLLTNRRYWKYLSPRYCWNASWWILRVEARKIVPAKVANLILQLAGWKNLPKSSSAP